MEEALHNPSALISANTDGLSGAPMQTRRATQRRRLLVSLAMVVDFVRLVVVESMLATCCCLIFVFCFISVSALMWSVLLL